MPGSINLAQATHRSCRRQSAPFSRFETCFRFISAPTHVRSYRKIMPVRVPCGRGPAHKPGRTGTRPARFWSQTKMPPRASGGGLVCRPGSAGKPWPASRQSGFSTWHAFYSSSFVVLMRAQLVAAAPDGQAGQKKLFGTPNPPGNWLSNPRRPVFALLRRGRPRNLRQDFYRTL